MRTKIGRLEEAFNGHFDEHHRFLLARMLARIDGIDADIAAVDNQIEAHLAPFAAAAARLDEIPGIGPVAAAIIIAEIGVDMSRFPTAGHLCSWAKFSPGISSSAGKTKGNGSTGHGNRYLARVLGRDRRRGRAAPTPSSASATGASPDDAARNARSSPSGAPSWSSSGTFSPTDTPDSPTSDQTTTPATSTRTPRNATTFANSKHSATPSPSPQPPEPT